MTVKITYGSKREALDMYAFLQVHTDLISKISQSPYYGTVFSLTLEDNGVDIIGSYNSVRTHYLYTWMTSQSSYRDRSFDYENCFIDSNSRDKIEIIKVQDNTLQKNCTLVNEDGLLLSIKKENYHTDRDAASLVGQLNRLWKNRFDLVITDLSY